MKLDVRDPKRPGCCFQALARLIIYSSSGAAFGRNDGQNLTWWDARRRTGSDATLSKPQSVVSPLLKLLLDSPMYSHRCWRTTACRRCAARAPLLCWSLRPPRTLWPRARCGCVDGSFLGFCRQVLVAGANPMLLSRPPCFSVAPFLSTFCSHCVTLACPVGLFDPRVRPGPGPGVDVWNHSLDIVGKCSVRALSASFAGESYTFSLSADDD